MKTFCILLYVILQNIYSTAFEMLSETKPFHRNHFVHAVIGHLGEYLTGKARQLTYLLACADKILQVTKTVCVYKLNKLYL